MNKNFWSRFNNNKPAYVLAPLAGFTDSAFRQICKSFGADVLYSEMISATALFYNDKKTVELMEFDKMERPYVIQLFGSEPRHFAIAVNLITKKEVSVNNVGIFRFAQNDTKIPDGIDINFGCPVPKVMRQGAGIALFQDLKRSREVIKATIEATDLPVSIKTRSQVKEIDVLKFLDNIKDLDVSAIMIHGRTGSAGFSGKVDADIIKKARNYFDGKIIANGGVYNYQDAQELLNKSEADGIGIGQGALGKPWIFKAVRTRQSVERSQRAIFKIIRKHAELVFKLKGEQGIIEMRKHLCWYVRGLPGAKKLREQLIQVNTLNNIEKILRA